MIKSRIKDSALADRITAGQLGWMKRVMPITAFYSEKIAKCDFRDKRIALWQHILPDVIPIVGTMQKAGAEILLGACNVDSTDDATAAYIAAQGITVLGWKGMTQAEYQENLRLARSFDADYLSDMGGELTEAYLDRQPPVVGALEATTSGLNRLKPYDLPFPVFDWNSIPLKEQIENRFHVGDGVWLTFAHLTAMGLFGRRVLVIGYGPVGKGIAERARQLVANVYVSDLDPVKLLEARYHGCEPIPLMDGLAHCQIIVTSTGVEGVLKEAQLRQVRQEAIVFNAGHSNREIEIDWLATQSHQPMKEFIERYDLGDRSFYLLTSGSPLNLGAGITAHGNDLFDHYSAVMLLGLKWMLDGGVGEMSNGLQLYPRHLEQEIANMSMELYLQG
jgi:adenosylhomocysteinase